MRNALVVVAAVVVGMGLALAGCGMDPDAAAGFAGLFGAVAFVLVLDEEARQDAEVAESRRRLDEWNAADAERRDRAEREARQDEARRRGAEHDRQMAELFGDLERIEAEFDDEFELSLGDPTVGFLTAEEVADLLDPPGKDVVVEADADGEDTEFQPKPPVAGDRNGRDVVVGTERHEVRRLICDVLPVPEMN